METIFVYAILDIFIFVFSQSDVVRHTMRHTKIHKIVLISTFFIFSHYSEAQNIQAILSKRVESLRSMGIDTLLVYSPCQSHNLPHLTDTCRFNNKNYIMWRKDKHTFLQKAADCFDSEVTRFTEFISKSVVLDSLNSFDFLLANIEAISKDTVLPAVIRQKKDDQYVFTTVQASHQCFTTIDIFIKNIMYSKGFSDLSFYDGIIRNEDGSVREAFESINYNYNKLTLIYKLSLLLESSIAYLENNNAFKF